MHQQYDPDPDRCETPPALIELHLHRLAPSSYPHLEPPVQRGVKDQPGRQVKVVAFHDKAVGGAHVDRRRGGLHRGGRHRLCTPKGEEHEQGQFCVNLNCAVRLTAMCDEAKQQHRPVVVIDSC